MQSIIKNPKKNWKKKVIEARKYIDSLKPTKDIPFSVYRERYSDVMAQMNYSRDVRVTFDALVLLAFDLMQETLPWDMSFGAAVLWENGKESEDPKLALGKGIVNMTQKEVVCIFMHEVGHVVMMHGARFPAWSKYNQYTGKLWNLATDAIINSKYGIIKKLQDIRSPIADSLISIESLRDRDVKIDSNDSDIKVYKALVDKVQERIKQLQKQHGKNDITNDILEHIGKQIGNTEGNEHEKDIDNNANKNRQNPRAGGEKSNQDEVTSSSKEALDDIIDDLLGGVHELSGVNVTEGPEGRAKAISHAKYALEMAKKSGKVPGEYAEDIELALRSPLVPWKKLIKRGVSNSLKRFTATQWHKLNRRYGLGWDKKKSLGSKVLFLVDTSGSMEDFVLEYIFSETKRVFKIGKLFVAQYDHGLQDIQQMRTFKKKFKVKGRGGTSLKQALEDLKEKKFPLATFDAVFIISDFYDHFESIPREIFGKASVKWLKTDDGNAPVPFGQVIDVSEQLRMERNG